MMIATAAEAVEAFIAPQSTVPPPAASTRRRESLWTTCGQRC